MHSFGSPVTRAVLLPWRSRIAGAALLRSAPWVSLALDPGTGCPGPAMSPDSGGPEQLCHVDEGYPAPAARLGAGAVGSWCVSGLWDGLG